MANHVDRTETHVLSVIVNVAQAGMDAPWPLHIEDHGTGVVNRVELRPGQMAFYESARCMHGRPEPLQGDAFANLFVHFRVRADGGDWYRKSTGASAAALAWGSTHDSLTSANMLPSLEEVERARALEDERRRPPLHIKPPPPRRGSLRDITENLVPPARRTDDSNLRGKQNDEADIVGAAGDEALAGSAAGISVGIRRLAFGGLFVVVLFRLSEPVVLRWRVREGRRVKGKGA